MINAPTLRLAVIIAIAVIAPANARADEPPVAPRVYYVPTAWLQPHARLYLTAGANHRAGAFASIATGLGGIAELDLTVTDQLIGCAVCSGDDRETTELSPITGQLKLGVGAGRLGRWQPALALGFRRSINARDKQIGGAVIDPELAQMYLVASWRISRLELHVGGDLWDGRSDGDGELLGDAPLSAQVRPFAGASWRLARYPRTSVLADFAWAPEMRATAEGPERPELAWLAGFGVRYQALRWASVELGVRARERDAENLVALLRFNLVWDP